jgi:hypothetical protein
MPKPNMMAQLQSQVGLGRPGGIASRGSSPVGSTPGGKFSAMENAMLKKLKPNPAKLAMGKKTRQFKTVAAEENQL